MSQKKLSKCVITGGKEILKELGIEFDDFYVFREERTENMFKLKTKKNGGKNERKTKTK